MSNYIKEKQAQARKAGNVTTMTKRDISTINILMLSCKKTLNEALEYVDGVETTTPPPALKVFSLSVDNEVVKSVSARTLKEAAEKGLFEILDKGAIQGELKVTSRVRFEHGSGQMSKYTAMGKETRQMRVS
jgi:hypothetical protein